MRKVPEKRSPQHEASETSVRGADAGVWAEAEARLREYERVVEGLQEMIAVIDRDYRYLIANKAFLNQRGLRRADVIGRQVSEVLDRSLFENIVKPRLDKSFAGHVVRYELKYDYPKLGPRDLAIAYFPIEGPGGVDRVACVLQDITDRKQAEEALKNSESEMSQAQHLAHIGSWHWDIQTNFRSWSKELFRIFGVNPAEPLPSIESILDKIVHPCDQDLVRSAVQASIATGEPCSVFYRIVRPDGTERIMHTRGNVILDESGKAVRMFGTAQDITERRQTEDALREAERKYREIFEYAGEGIFQSTPEGRYIAANPALAEMYGYETPEELISECNDISRQIYVDSSRRDEFMGLIGTQGMVRGFEIQVFRKDGTKFWVMVNARAVCDRDEKVSYYEGTTQDITERKRAALTSAAFAALARKLSGAQTHHDAADIIAQTAQDLFGWEACNLDLYDAEFDSISPLLNVDTINGRQVDVTPSVSTRPPTSRQRRILEHGPELILREKPIQFDSDSVPFGDEIRPAASIMCVPIKHGDDIVGLFSVQSYTLNAYDQAELRDLVALAEHCGEAINRIRVEQSFHESEERYRELFENSRDAIYVHDLNGRYVSVNRAAEELSGFRREEILGKHYSNFVSPRHLKNARESFCRKLDAPVETTYEAEVVCKNGQRKPVEISSRMIYKDGVAIGVQGTARDVSERKRAQEILQNYSRRLIEAQEAERQSVARELHDEIGQVLTAVRMNLQSVKKSCQSDLSLPRIDESIDVIDEALTRVRELSLELRPSLLDDLGLAAALRWYADQYTLRSGIAAEVMGDSQIGRIPHDVETACFRITQEALTNTARHAEATKASVHIERQNGQLCLTITDNGIGFDSDRYLNGVSSAAALGLRGMQERALAVRGHVEINSAPDKGTQIVVRVPLNK